MQRAAVDAHSKRGFSETSILVQNLNNATSKCLDSNALIIDFHGHGERP